MRLYFARLGNNSFSNFKKKSVFNSVSANGAVNRHF